MGQRNNCGHNRHADGAFCHRLYEGSIDLQRRNWQMRKVSKRRVTSAEVVNSNTQSEFSYRIELGDIFFNIAHQ